MIKYDYFLKRDEKNALREFRPEQIPKEINNLVHIEGPNSSGKSTFLNILALGLHGRSEEFIIRRALREKMDNLISGKHQKLTFEISITNKDGEVELVSKKSNPDNEEIVVRDSKNKIIGPEEFAKKYRLIYDIPENPTERLKELIHEIEQTQTKYAQRVGMFQRHLEKVISDIREARNPQKIEKTQKELEICSEAMSTEEREAASLEEKLKEVKTYTAVKFYIEYKEQYGKYKEALNSLKKGDKERGRFIKKVTKRYKDTSNELRKLTGEMKDIYFKVTPVLKSLMDKKEKNHLQIWQEINIDQELKNYKVKKDLKVEAMYFIEVLKKMAREHSGEKGLQEANVYTQLIALLENYKDLDIKLPGVGLKISEFIKALKEEAGKYEEVVAGKRAIDETVRLLNDLLEKRYYIIDNLAKILDSIEEVGAGEEHVEHDEDAAKYEEMERRLKGAEDRVNYYKMECAKLDIKESVIGYFFDSVIGGAPFKGLKILAEADLREKIADMAKAITEKKEDVVKKKEYIRYLAEELKKLEKSQPHQYHKHLDYLERVYQVARSMEKKLAVEFDEYVKELKSSKKPDKSSATKEKQRYFNLVFEFLAKRIGSIIHIDKEYELKKVDYLDGTIYTTCGKEIKIPDMGTGQSQNAYLMGLLNADDSRKMIALFDEAAMMDQRSLQPVYKKLKELRDKGKLLVGVVVQMAEKLSVRPIF